MDGIKKNSWSARAGATEALIALRLPVIYSFDSWRLTGTHYYKMGSIIGEGKTKMDAKADFRKKLLEHLEAQQ
jgi:hypothetical protein